MTDPDPASMLPLTPLTYHVLLALADSDRHGYGIIKEVLERTSGQMELETGTLYTALGRLRDDELIEPVPENERPEGEDGRRRTYRLTPFGRKVLEAESRRLAELVTVAAEKRVIPAISG
ncbi:PadR family transcriptional regulator [Gemmatimonadota bacterium]